MPIDREDPREHVARLENDTKALRTVFDPTEMTVLAQVVAWLNANETLRDSMFGMSTVNYEMNLGELNRTLSRLRRLDEYDRLMKASDSKSTEE